MNKFFYIVTLTCALYAGSCQLGFASPYESGKNYNGTPADIAARQWGEKADESRKHGRGEDQWKTLIVYSNGTGRNLKLVLDKNAKFTMSLDPKEELLYFEKPDMKQVFDPKANYGGRCPSYTISVIDASATYAVFKRFCFFNDAAPRKSTMGITYYLYDIKPPSCWISGVQSQMKRMKYQFFRNT